MHDATSSKIYFDLIWIELQINLLSTYRLKKVAMRLKHNHYSITENELKMYWHSGLAKETFKAYNSPGKY